MSDWTEAELKARLRKVEALHDGATTPGEKRAAAEALARLRARLAQMRRSDAVTPIRFRINDPWSRQLFLALARRHGYEPYRKPGQQRATVVLMAPRRFVDEVLWPEFAEINRELVHYLAEVTDHVIASEVGRAGGRG